MERKQLTNESPAQNVTDQHLPEGKPAADVEVSGKPAKKRKKKHSSSMLAAAKAKSVVSEAGANAYRDTDFSNTGTNITYRED